MKKSPATRIRLMLVDDHPIVREGIKSAFVSKKHINIVGEASTGEEAVRKAVRLKPHIILMDINMPGMSGLEAARRIGKLVPESKILALTMHENKEYIIEMSRIGARGYVFKDSPPAELLKAIETVHRGEFFFSPRASQHLLRAFLQDEPLRQKKTSVHLTTREREILALVVEGLKNLEIAGQLGVTERTVETYRHRLMQKLEVRSVAGLIKFAIAEGITEV
jgi:two-component system nitrate/nitrite response regulator NarL